MINEEKAFFLLFLGRFCQLCFKLVCVVLWCLLLLALWSPGGRGLTSWLSCLLCFVTFPNVSCDRPKAVLLLWIFYVFSALCLLCLCARLFICASLSPAGKG